MSNKPNPSRSKATGRARAAAGPGRGPWIIGGVIVAVVLALLVAVIVNREDDGGNAALSGPAPASVVEDVTSVPPEVIDEVGGGSASRLPTAITGGAGSTSGKPEVLYIGAEYCPFCAGQRWALVNALGRFGSFTALGQTHSSSTDVFPDTATFTFDGTTFTSDDITFTAVETASSEPDGQGGYEALDSPTAEQMQTWQALDPDGSIPFIHLDGRFFITGATVDPAVLEGKTLEEIASALDDPSSEITRAVIGAANGITATICEATGGQPAAVCEAEGVAGLREQLQEAGG